MYPELLSLQDQIPSTEKVDALKQRFFEMGVHPYEYNEWVNDCLVLHVFLKHINKEEVGILRRLYRSLHILLWLEEVRLIVWM